MYLVILALLFILAAAQIRDHRRLTAALRAMEIEASRFPMHAARDKLISVALDLKAEESNAYKLRFRSVKIDVWSNGGTGMAQVRKSLAALDRTPPPGDADGPR